jgi:mercuric ion transport protein
MTRERLLVVGSALGSAGSALVALLAGLCCVGPAVLAALGLGGALAGASLTPYRPYLLAASALMLGFGFWRVYRPRRDCAAGACPSVGRAARISLWCAALIAGLSLILPNLA